MIAALLATLVLGAGPQQATIGVSVATLWTRPGIARPVDAPSLGNPVRMRAWSRALTVPDRRRLVGKLETQALLGEPVLVLERRGAWSHVVVTDQPTPRDRRGYPGWLPTVQLGAARPPGGAVVVRPTAWLRDAAGRPRTELSYGTRLRVLGRSGPLLRVAGGTVRTADVATSLAKPTGSEIVRAARMFLGVPYVWAGTAAYGLDCSGLIHLVYRAHGIVIPRDADAQAAAGTPVAASSLRSGDLLFYGRGHVHHVTLYVGGGRMLEAPRTGTTVRISPVRWEDYAGARRYLR